MISLVITAEDGSQHTEWLQKTDIALGRAPGNDVVLVAKSVSKRHARIVQQAHKHIIVDLRSRNGTFVNGRRLTSPMIVREGDLIYLGAIQIAIVVYDASSADDDDTVEVDVVEMRLLANVASHEPGAREVYADWLDEHGDPVRAEYVRLQDLVSSAAGPGGLVEREQLEARLRVLGARLDPQWRIKLARQPIQGCNGLACPGDWGNLDSTRDPEIRSCADCAELVFYCVDARKVRAHAVAQEPVVLDLVCRQPPDDEPLTWQPGRCGGPDVED